MRLSEKYAESYNQLNISLPYIIVSKMRLPFHCKSHWKVSMHRRSNISGKYFKFNYYARIKDNTSIFLFVHLVLHNTNPLASTFIKQYWAWEWNDGLNVLWKNWNDLNDSDISEKLRIQENEFLCLRFSFPHYYCQQQLYNIQNSTTHDAVSCALDYLTM